MFLLPIDRFLTTMRVAAYNRVILPMAAEERMRCFERERLAQTELFQWLKSEVEPLDRLPSTAAAVDIPVCANSSTFQQG
jgi:hypothetical protein